MAHKSWGVSPGTPVPPRSNADPDARAAARARAREERAAARAAEAAGKERAAPRPRGSGRRDVVREQRDTRGYATLVDTDRLRTLSAKGTSPTGLAAAFGITEEEVRRVLAGE